jgi:hypothetical protein
MTAMLLIGLLLKIAMTVTIVVAASVVVERSGPSIGSLIAALPTAASVRRHFFSVSMSFAFSI